MKHLSKLFGALLLLVIPMVSWGFENLPDSGNMPDVVNVRTNCFPGDPKLEVKNCADNMTDMLDWVWGTRNPSATSPLLIEIGPGHFPLPDFTCSLDLPNPVNRLIEF